MRKIALLLLGLLCSLSIVSGEVSEEQALQKACQILKGKQLMKPLAARSRNNLKVENAYYVFNAVNNGGFVIVAGDDSMRDILGYSERGNLNLAELPDNVKWLLDYYAQVANATSGAAPAKTPAKASRPELAPLITTTWDQGAPYNDQCPVIKGKKTLTGCVATAMAQVVNYFQWPISDARSVAAYKTKTSTIDVPALPARKFRWSNMTDEEIAWLMRYCGQAVQMDYTTDESGALATDIAGALITVFDYSKTTTFVMRNSYSDTEWEELMYNELSVGRPVIYNGDNGPGSAGHSFVLNGYRNGMFYVNWGWSGNCDGYFALTDLSPNAQQHYTQNQNAIIAIQPSSNNDDEGMTAGEELTVRLEKAGTLSNFISDNDKYKFKKLTISGEINGTDIILIRDMAGFYNNQYTDGQLATLDLSDAQIVSGGQSYNYGYTTSSNAIGHYMFDHCRKLQEVILPDNITEIGYGAFGYCNLRSVFIPKSVNFIGTGAFSGCSNLQSIVVEEGNPSYYSMPDVCAIFQKEDGKLFAGTPSTVIPEGVTTIARGAFSELIGLKTIKLPESLTTVEDGAFQGAHLVSLHLPKNVNHIGDGAFGNGELKSITVDSKNTTYEAKNNCLIEKANKKVILGCITSEIPEGIESVGRAAFNSCINIQYLTLPQSLKQIENEAFLYCRFRQLEIPANVERIGDSAFGMTDFLKICKVKAATPPTMNSGAFSGNKEDIQLIVPNGTKDKYKAATGWQDFKTILEEKEYQASYTVDVKTAGTLSSLIPAEKRKSIEELVLTGHLNEEDFKFIREEMSSGAMRVLDMTNARVVDDAIAPRGFQSTYTVEEIKLPNTIKSIGWNAFWDSGIKSIVIPKSVTELGADIFYQCDHLSSITVEKGNPVFDSRENCNAIIETATNTLRNACRSTVVPSSVVALGNTAFSGVNGLITVDLPDGVKSIGTNAFWADKGLTSVKLSKSIVELGVGPFVGCANITSFVIDPANPVYDSRNNCNAIIETATNTLVQGFGSTKIPETVVKIAPQAYMYQEMTSVEIPAGVTEIGAACFKYCNNMTTVISHIKKPFPVTSSVFEGDNMKTAVLYVPYGTKKAYSTTAGWASFPKIVEMDPTDDDFSHYGATVETADFGKQYAGLNGEILVPVYLVGESIDPITNIDYTITTGSNTVKGHLDLTDPLTYMMTAQVLIPFSADAKIGEKAKKLTITKVNGHTNEATEKTASGTLVTVKRKPKFVPLVEEATGTWCGWCPRGAVGLNLINKTFRDDVVTVAVHSNDVMVLPGYSLNVSGYPSCMINRGSVIDPYFGSSDASFGIKYDIEAAQREYTIGEISLEAAWKDDKQTAINVTTTTTFVENVKSSPYQIGFILLEDKQTGTGSAWAQSNYYSGAANNDPNLKVMVSSPSKIAGMKYDHVPVAVWEHQSGIKGSIPATITSETPMSFSYTLDIANNKRIQNKENLTVVALLVNKESNAVINAAKFSFKPAIEPSVVTVTSCKRTYGDENPVFEYTVTGGELQGEPEISCEATAASSVGEYPIVIKQGTVTNEEVEFVNGTLTIEKAKLTATAEDCEREQGTQNPVFTITYKGWKNNDDENVLQVKPVATTEATIDSPVGTYPITVSGGKATNYIFEYVAGVLTVIESSGISEFSVDCPADIYDLKGHLVRKGATTLNDLPTGIYIRNGKKIVITK